MIKYLVEYGQVHEQFMYRKVIGPDVLQTPATLMFDDLEKAKAVTAKLNLGLDHAKTEAKADARAELQAELRALLGVV